MEDRAKDRTEVRDDLPEEVKHPDRAGPSGPSLAVAMGVAAALMIALALAVTLAG